MMNLDIFAGNNVQMNLDILAEDNVNDIKEILSGSEGKTICIISVDHFVGLVTKMDQDSLGLMNVVTIEGGAECLPDLRLMGEDRAYRKLKRYVESDRQMDSTITLDDKAYSCREVEALYYDAKENISKLIGSLQKNLADAGFEEDEAVYVIGGIRTLDYLIMHYCREELSANALLQDKRIHVDPSDTLYECMKEAVSEYNKYNSGKEAGNTEAGGGQAVVEEAPAPRLLLESTETESREAEDMMIFTDLPHRMLPKENNSESGLWHKVELSMKDLDGPLTVQIHKNSYCISLPTSIKNSFWEHDCTHDCTMEERERISYIAWNYRARKEGKNFIVEVKFWGETYAENHLYLRGDSSCMGPDNTIYHYDFSHPKKTS